MKFIALLKKHKYLFGTLLVCILIFGVLAPQFYTSLDEREYIQNAYLLTHNDLIRTDVQCPGDGNSAYGFFNGAGCVSKYNLGLSIIFAPFVAIHWQLVFLVTFSAFLVSIFLFYNLLRLNNLDARFVMLYAFYPALNYYSIKPMTEIFSSMFILLLFTLTVKFLEKRKLWLLFALGLVGGISVLVRYSNVLLIVATVGYILVTLLKAKVNFHEITKYLISLALGALPFLLLFFVINQTLYGGILKSGYNLSGEEGYFSFAVLLKQLPWYLLIFLGVYPLMLISTFVNKIKHKALIMIFFVILCFLYLGFPGFNFDQGLLNSIFGVRFFIPIISLLILCYASLLTQIFEKMKLSNSFKAIFFSLALIILLIGKIIMTLQIYNYVKDYRATSDAIYSNSKPGDTVDASPIFINDAFNKGPRYLQNLEPWIPLKDRKSIYINQK